METQFQFPREAEEKEKGEKVKKEGCWTKTETVNINIFFFFAIKIFSILFPLYSPEDLKYTTVEPQSSDYLNSASESFIIFLHTQSHRLPG